MSGAETRVGGRKSIPLEQWEPQGAAHPPQAVPKDQGMRGRAKGSWRDSHTRVWSWWTEYPRKEGEVKLTVEVNCSSSHR